MRYDLVWYKTFYSSVYLYRINKNLTVVLDYFCLLTLRYKVNIDSVLMNDISDSYLLHALIWTVKKCHLQHLFSHIVVCILLITSYLISGAHSYKHKWCIVRDYSALLTEDLFNIWKRFENQIIMWTNLVLLSKTHSTLVGWGLRRVGCICWSVYLI